MPAPGQTGITQALILVGGKGTRLMPLTHSAPKPLMPVGNIPLLRVQLDLLAKNGVKEVVLSLYYQYERFQEEFRARPVPGLKVRFNLEEEPLGTAGAVKLAEGMLQDRFFVLNGDILSDIPYQDMAAYHLRHRAVATLALITVEDPTIYGVIETDHRGRVQSFLEKPAWDEVTCSTINAGVYILNKSVLEHAPAGEVFSFERELYPDLLAMGKAIYGYPFNGYWMDVGTLDKYYLANMDLLRGRIKTLAGLKLTRPKKLSRVTVSDPVMIHPTAHISPGAIILGPTVIGPGCRIGPLARIRQSVLHAGVEVGEKVDVNKCILGDGVKIKDNAFLSEGLVLAQGAVIKSGVGKLQYLYQGLV